VSLAARLVITVALTALFSAGLTGYLSHRAASDRVPRAFGVTLTPRGHGAGQPPASEDRPAMVGATNASRQLLAELQRATTRAAIIALALAIVAGGYVAFRSTRPIARLADVTRRYGAGERDLRAPERGPEEVAALARVFNDTADRLRDEEAQRQRLTTDIAHELRTPLTVLKSELEAVQDGLMSADADTVEQLLQQVDLLARLVQDLRLLTLAEAGELTLHRGATDLGALVGRAARAFGARAAEARIHLTVATGEAPTMADVDPERLRQVVNALLDNALRHAPAGSTLEVRVTRRENEARIDVLDEGPGIPPEQASLVFQRLYRLDDARRREDGGSGLGLAIVAAIVALHGGRVEAGNRPTGGARLTVTLPLRTP